MRRQSFVRWDACSLEAPLKRFLDIVLHWHQRCVHHPPTDLNDKGLCNSLAISVWQHIHGSLAWQHPWWLLAASWPGPSIWKNTIIFTSEVTFGLSILPNGIECTGFFCFGCTFRPCDLGSILAWLFGFGSIDMFDSNVLRLWHVGFEYLAATQFVFGSTVRPCDFGSILDAFGFGIILCVWLNILKLIRAATSNPLTLANAYIWQMDKLQSWTFCLASSCWPYLILATALRNWLCHLDTIWLIVIVHCYRTYRWRWRWRCRWRRRQWVMASSIWLWQRHFGLWRPPFLMWLWRPPVFIWFWQLPLNKCATWKFVLAALFANLIRLWQHPWPFIWLWQHPGHRFNYRHNHCCTWLDSTMAMTMPMTMTIKNDDDHDDDDQWPWPWPWPWHGHDHGHHHLSLATPSNEDSVLATPWLLQANASRANTGQRCSAWFAIAGGSSSRSHPDLRIYEYRVQVHGNHNLWSWIYICYAMSLHSFDGLRVHH